MPRPMAGSSTVVVVGFAEALAAPEVVWSLVEAGCAVVAFSRVGKPAALNFSRHARVHKIPDPEWDLEASLEGLRQLLDRVRGTGEFGQHVLLPLDDAALMLCSRVPVNAGWTFAGPPNAAALELALNKQRQVEAARAAGLDVPDTMVATEVVDLQRLPFHLPVILRPALAIRESGRRIRKGKNWICANEGELRAAAAQWNGDGPLLVQPYLDGVGEGIFGHATDRGVSYWSGHRRVRMMNPHGSGSSACASRPVDENVKASTVAFLNSVGWRGMFMLEMLRTPTGELRFVEFNGRAWGSMALARRQGFEYPAWTVQLALGERADLGSKATVHEGMICRNLGREIMHVLFVLRGPRSKAVRAWPSLGRTLLDVLRWPQHSGFYNWRRDDWKVLLSDSYYTILRNVRKTSEP